ncbi:MAG: DUF1549 domain-containing protein [Planctomycetaceae bacterium]|nr:DUF1549 domain-containing protein [Planctomycetales bacterium]MCB9938534.1 DUF1549 domain-containing protein [Planctomycetaceae bacterium]
MMKMAVQGIRTGALVTVAFAAMIGLTRADDFKLEPVQVGEPQRIEVFPPAIKLNGVREQMQIVVTGFYPDGSVQDLTRAAEFASSNAEVFNLKGSVAHPKADGSADLKVSVGGQEASVAVSVANQGAPQPVSFEYGTLAALSKQGCNAGACHGSPSGKGGFRLSLRAFDPELDKLTLIHEDFGRRTNSIEPAESLLLLKPLMKVPHGGGLKIHANDSAYEVIRDWISEGCNLDPPEQPRVVKLEVYPPSGRLLKRPAHTQQLAVLAHYADGSVRDVTELAVYSSSDEAVASITENGLVVGKDRGESAVIVRFMEFIESSFVTFVRDIEGFAWNNPPINNYIDEAVDAKLQQLKFLPSSVCTDEEFIRRVYLDVIGILPTIAETQQFFADTSADKRAKLIDQLLERPEFAKFWTLKWGDLLRLTSKQVGDDGVYKYHRWVERAIETNMPYDQFARELLTASGSTHLNPPANFYRTATDTNDCVETISQVFLGARLQCAKCHNHPFERWSQDNYYGMAAFFNRVQRKNTPKPDETFIWVSSSGEVTQPRTGKQMKPWLPGDGDVEKADVDDRRGIFAEWLTRPDNPFFAKIEANRIWSHLFGRGIVDPPDDFRDSNPPSNAALLEALSADFVKSGFDRKHVIRTILNSRTYQSSFEPNDFNKDDTKYFSHYQPRLLSAEQLLDAICDVTAVPEKFGSLPPTTRATQLPAPDLVKHEFLKIFGQPERQTVCQCERSSESNLGMAIQFFNGPLIYNKLRDGNNRFRQLLNEQKADQEIITQLHFAAVNRPPTEKELAATMKHISSKDEQIAQHNTETDAKIVAMNKAIADMRRTFEVKLFDTKLQAIPETLRADVKAALAAEEGKRSEVQKYLVEKLGASLAVSADEVTNALDEEAKKMVADSTAQIAELEKQKQALGSRRIEALEDVCWALLNTNEFLFQH